MGRIRVLGFLVGLSGVLTSAVVGVSILREARHEARRAGIT